MSPKSNNHRQHQQGNTKATPSGNTNHTEDQYWGDAETDTDNIGDMPEEDVENEVKTANDAMPRDTSHDTDMGQDKAPDEHPSRIKQFSEADLIAEMERRDRENAPPPPPPATGDTRIVRELSRIRRNLDVMLLIMHTMTCVAFGGVAALAWYLQHTGLMVGAGGTFAFMVMTLLVKLVLPGGNLKDIVNSKDLMKSLRELTQNEIAKLMQAGEETGYFRGSDQR